MGQPFIDQDSFAWLQDDNDLEANTAIGSTNDQLTSPTLDSNYRLRFLLQNTGDKDGGDAFRLESNYESAGWVAVTNATSYVKYVQSTQNPNPSDGDATAQSIGAGTFDEGYYEDSGSDFTTFTFAQGQESELEVCIQFVAADLNDTDVVQLQIAYADGTPLDSYTNAVSTTIVKAADPAPSVSDSISVTESATASPVSFINVSDSITVTDTPDVGDVANPNVSDSITVTDIPRHYADVVHVAESVSLSIETAFEGVSINVSDSVSVAEAVTVRPVINADVSDSVNATDTPAIGDIANIGVSDSVSVAESVTVNDRPPWYNTDTLVINTGSITNNAIEDTWTDDGAKLELAETSGTPGFDYEFWFQDVPGSAASITFNGYYSGNPGHQVTIEQWDYTGVDWTALTGDNDDFPSAGADYTLMFRLFNDADYNDGGEMRLRIVHNSGGINTHSFYIDHFQLGTDPAIHINEAITVTDSPVARPIIDIDVSDAVGVAESVAAAIGVLPDVDTSVSDTVTVAESVDLDITAEVNVSDAVSVTDTPEVGDVANIDVSDSVSIAENVGLDIATIPSAQVSVSDSISVSDSSTVQGGANANVSDSISVTDSASVALPALTIASTDNINVAETVVVSPLFNVDASETITVSESVDGSILLEITVSDSVAVAESSTLSGLQPGDVQLVTSDNVTVTEYYNVDNILTLLDVSLSDSAVYSVVLSDAAVYDVSLSDDAVYDVVLSDVSRT